MHIEIDLTLNDDGSADFHVGAGDLAVMLKALLARFDSSDDVRPVHIETGAYVSPGETDAGTVPIVDALPRTLRIVGDDLYRACGSYSCNHLGNEHIGGKCHRKHCPCAGWNPIAMVG